MAAQTREEEQRQNRRQRLLRGLVLGGLAVGVPALVNTVVSRRARRLPATRWGSGDHWAWSHGDVAYQRLGAGPPVVLLHSLGPGHSANEWRRAAEILALDRRVYAPDLPGWGRSGRTGFAYRAATYVEWLAYFLREVVGSEAVVVAAGLPGAWTARLAADHPELVRALALVVPRGVEARRSTPELKDALLHGLLRLPVLGTSALNIYTSRAAIGAYLRDEVYASPHLVDDDLVEEHYRSSHLAGAHGALAAYSSGLLYHDVRDALPLIEAPVWLGWGRRALAPPVETADLWLRYLGDVELEIFEQCGILPHAESPEEFCRKLDQFLSARA